MAVTYAPLSASNASVLVGDTFLPCVKWNVNFRSKEEESTNFEGEGFEEHLGPGGIVGAEISIELLYDPQNFKILTDLSLYPNSYVSLTLYPNRAQSETNTWAFTKALVCSVRMDAEVRGAIRCSLELLASGKFTHPS